MDVWRRGQPNPLPGIGNPQESVVYNQAVSAWPLGGEGGSTGVVGTQAKSQLPAAPQERGRRQRLRSRGRPAPQRLESRAPAPLEPPLLCSPPPPAPTCACVGNIGKNLLRIKKKLLTNLFGSALSCHNAPNGHTALITGVPHDHVAPTAYIGQPLLTGAPFGHVAPAVHMGHPPLTWALPVLTVTLF